MIERATIESPAPVPGKNVKKKKLVRGEKVAADLRVTLSRTEADIKQHTARKEKLKAEIERLARQIGHSSMSVTFKQQELRKEEEKIRELHGICSRCRKLLYG